MPSISRALNRIAELNKKEKENYNKEKLRYEKKANKCEYCKRSYIRIESESNCKGCGAKLPKYEWPIAPPFEWVLR